MAELDRVSSGSFRLRVGTFIVELGDSRLKAVLAAALIGAGAGLCEYVVHESLRYSRFGQSMDAFMDAVVVGIAAALVVSVWLFAARERRKRVLREMAKVSELNHNVRNALQVIAHSHYGVDDTHTDMVLESVDRIERTLKELFPGVEAPAQEKVRVVFSKERRRAR